MKKSLKHWQIGGFIFTCISGVLLHFLYEWTDKSLMAALFSAVNESIWEHMKLLFFPMFIFALIEYKFIGRNFTDYWCSKLFGILSGLILIPIIYYTYTGMLGVNADWFNIVIFFISAASAYCIESILINNSLKICKSSYAAFRILCIIAVSFIILTFIQPKIPLFRDMSKDMYGMF